MTIAVPVSFSLAGRWIVMVDLVTLVISFVESVTSTSLRLSFGDGRSSSAPMLPISSGALPGHSSTTSGLSSAAAGAAEKIAATQMFVRFHFIFVSPWRNWRVIEKTAVSPACQPFAAGERALKRPPYLRWPLNFPQGLNHIEPQGPNRGHEAADHAHE